MPKKASRLVCVPRLAELALLAPHYRHGIHGRSIVYDLVYLYQIIRLHMVYAMIQHGNNQRVSVDQSHLALPPSIFAAQLGQ
jgi:hypothetical protein